MTSGQDSGGYCPTNVQKFDLPTTLPEHINAKEGDSPGHQQKKQPETPLLTTTERELECFDGLGRDAQQVLLIEMPADEIMDQRGIANIGQPPVGNKITTA